MVKKGAFASVDDFVSDLLDGGKEGWSDGEIFENDEAKIRKLGEHEIQQRNQPLRNDGGEFFPHDESNRHRQKVEHQGGSEEDKIKGQPNLYRDLAGNDDQQGDGEGEQEIIILADRETEEVADDFSSGANGEKSLVGEDAIDGFSCHPGCHGTCAYKVQDKELQKENDGEGKNGGLHEWRLGMFRCDS